MFLALLAACTRTPAPESPVDSPVDSAQDSPAETGEPRVIEGAECPGEDAELGTTTGNGDCVTTQSGESATMLVVRPDCTDEEIRGHLDKRHVVMIPAGDTRDVLWVHFPGTGGQPSNTTNILETAASAGYLTIGLAYINEPSSSARCFCLEEGPRPPECEERVRAEVVYGDDVTDWYGIEPQESIEARLGSLLRSLHQSRPSDGWDRFLEEDGVTPDWSRTAVSGFSQGGGMAGLIARDHAVDRAIYFSLSTGSVVDVLLGEPVQSCASDEECGGDAVCCDIGDPVGHCTAEGADDPICLRTVPSLLAYTGADTDGDRIGDADERLTPGSRQFAVVHRGEDAFTYSPEVWELWGMGSRDDIVDADAVSAPYDADARVFSTALPPRNDCSEHQSMGANACQPLVDGEPAMRPVWLHAMTADLE